MKNCYKLIEDLEHNLKVLESEKSNIHSFLENNIKLCREALAKLRTYIQTSKFKNKKDEIQFYKCIKPRVSSYLIFYNNLFQIESKRDKAGKQEEIQYLKNFITKFQIYFSNNMEFYHYYKSNATHFDQQYFLMVNKKIRLNTEAYHYFTEDKFSTSYDSAVATILAHTKLIEYLKNEIDKLTNTQQNMETIQPFNKHTQLKWTASKTDLTELIYALQEANAINNGMSDTKEVVKVFENVLDIKLGNFYNTFIEIKPRKIKTTKFIDTLKEKLIQRIIKSDN